MDAVDHAARLARVLEAEEAEMDAELDRAAIAGGHIHRQLLNANPSDAAVEFRDTWNERLGSLAFALAAPMETSEIEVAVLEATLADARRCGLRLS